jgi:epoxyqueuosine reductase QueG
MNLTDEMLLECAISGNAAIVPCWTNYPLRWTGTERYMRAVRAALANEGRPSDVPTVRQWRKFSAAVRLHARGLRQAERLECEP